MTGPENSDSFYIEGAPNNGPNPNDNFADDSDFGANYQQHSYRGGPRGQMGGMRGGGGGMTAGVAGCLHFEGRATWMQGWTNWNGS